MKTRRYSFKDVDMLMATKTLISNFKTHQNTITAIRSIWEDPFITNFEKQVNHAIKNYLGLEAKKDLKLATQQVLQIQANALKDLALFKVSIHADYASDKTQLKWMLDTFGLTAHLKMAQQRDQEALIQLLQKFTNNMTAELKAQITQKGTSLTLIENIEEYADKLTIANTTQEVLKGTSKELTQTTVTEFNKIYTQSIAICTVVAKIFKDEPAKKDKFIFRKLVSNLNTQKTITVEQPLESH